MKLEQSHGAIALAAILAVAASAVLLANDYRSEAAGHRAVVLARGQTTLDALVAGIRAHGRMGRFRHERLSLIFEELAQTPDIIGVSLHGTAGPIASGGDATGLAGMAPDSESWENGVFLMTRPVALELGGHGPGPGMGRGWSRDGESWEPFPAGPHVAAVALDATDMQHEIDRDRTRGYLTFAAVLLMVTSGTVASMGWLRRRRLQTDLILARGQAAHQEKLTRLGAGLAHETKNPLGIIRGQAQLIAGGDGTPEEDQRRAGIIVDEIDRTVGQIDGFLKLARPQDLSPKPVVLRDLMASLVTLVNDDARAREIALVSTVDHRTIRADEPQLRRALLNLILNAMQASSAGGRVEIAAVDEPGGTAVEVRDSGRGIAPDDLYRVTEPYFSRFESGCGLGLALVQQIADAHGWTLDIQSTPGAGTVVALRGIQTIQETADA